MRVYELAKELGLDSKALLAKLHERGVVVKSHMSTLDEDTLALIRDEHAAPAATAPEPRPAEPASKPAPAADHTPAPAKPAAPAGPTPKAADDKPDQPLPKPATAKVIKIRGGIVVKDLAALLNVKPNVLIGEMMRMSMLATINERLDFPIAEKIAAKYGFRVEHERRAADHTSQKVEEEDVPEDHPEDLLPRAPVVTFLGHVDHGKTSLLDRIRSSTVALGESGGITQHIGAYTVDLNGQSITFLDTPGHAAFTAMRARGANLTDIAVIIIAADDGIMPQTREAIAHARAAGVAIMVAVNKIDLPSANVDRVMVQLQQENLAPEDWGGETICCPVSAQTGEGVDHLLEMILLQSEVLEIKANPNRRAAGFVIEARMEAGMGPTANLLVTAGTLKVGDAILCGAHWGRVRALINDHGIKVNAAKPSTPIKCLGLSGVPEAGAEFKVLANDRKARAMAQSKGLELKSAQLAAPAKKTSLDDLFSQFTDQQEHELRVVIKADTQGSIEAITHALGEIESAKITLRIVHAGAGNINTGDVMLASASNAVVLGFHVGKESGVDSVAKHEGVEIRLHQVIYELLDEVKQAMIGALGPSFKERVRGRAEIRQIFDIGKSGRVAGCLVVQGSIIAKLRARVLRAGEVQYTGGIVTLKHFQDNVAEVREAQECGIRLDFEGIEVGDTIECYQVDEVEQTL
jgi:translation initiation factor IF-2